MFARTHTHTHARTHTIHKRQDAETKSESEFEFSGAWDKMFFSSSLFCIVARQQHWRLAAGGRM